VVAGASSLILTGSAFLRIRGGADAVRSSGNLSERSLIEDCRFESAEDDGIDMTLSSVDVRSNSIFGAADAAVFLAGDGALGRSTLTWNVIDGSGAGIALADGAHVDDGQHNTVSGNLIGFHLFSGNGGNDGGHGTFHSVIAWCNQEEVLMDSRSSATFAFSDLSGGIWPGGGNISTDPRFVDWLAGDYGLRSSSPCIGTGEAGSDMGALTSSGAPAVFIRGDFDGSGGVNITDVIGALSFVFRSGAGPVCLDAADANDDGSVDISDSVFTLFFLFRGDVTPRAPFPAPGPDPTADALGC
jgi:parallel beta helix pectate lyase-like protein